mgnify:CR=1 FL=1
MAGDFGGDWRVSVRLGISRGSGSDALRACQSPAGFFMSRWKGGAKGSFEMGLYHGLFCLGCCWALMLLLFVGGVMNLSWVLLLTVGVLAEKTIPAGKALSNMIGVLLIGFGCYTFYGLFTKDI